VPRAKAGRGSLATAPKIINASLSASVLDSPSPFERVAQRLLAKSADNKAKNDKERYPDAMDDHRYSTYIAIEKGTG
jgi:hypothetical protein